MVQLSAWLRRTAASWPPAGPCPARAGPGAGLHHRAAGARPRGRPGRACGSFCYSSLSRDRKLSISVARQCTARRWPGPQLAVRPSPRSSRERRRLAQPNLGSRQRCPPPSPPPGRLPSAKPRGTRPPVSGRALWPFPRPWVRARQAAKRGDLRPRPRIPGLGAQPRPPPRVASMVLSRHRSPLSVLAPGRGVKRFAQVAQGVPVAPPRPPLPLPGHRADCGAGAGGRRGPSRGAPGVWRTDEREVGPGKTGRCA